MLHVYIVNKNAHNIYNVFSTISVLEVIGPSKRGTLAMIFQLGTAISYTLLTAASYVVRDHQLLQVVSGVPPLLILCFYW